MSEKQIYRIDHYLGKETVQNILISRFSNVLFEAFWNNHYIDHVQITAAETVGVETRGNFFEKTGTLRDMVPNHLFQLLAMVAMEPPAAFGADAVRGEKAKVIGAVRPWSLEDARANSVRGQYTAGEIGGKALPGYREEANVAPDSSTETFVALKVMIDNWRWVGVPFYLRTGKRMSIRDTEIVICFKPAPYAQFRDTEVDELKPTYLKIQIQPNEGMWFDLLAKRPGPTLDMANIELGFAYEDFFEMQPSTGYETLIYDCMTGDQTLFQRADNIENGWRAVQPFLDAWKEDDGIQAYKAGEDGPAAADALLARDGRAWHSRFGSGQVRAKGLFDHHAAEAVIGFRQQAGTAQALHHFTEEARRGGQVEHRVAGATVGDLLADVGVGAVVEEVALDVADALGQLHPQFWVQGIVGVTPDLPGSFGANEVLEFLGEVGIADGVVINADNAQAIAQQAVTAEVVQRRHEQALDQVAVGAKQKQGGGRSGFGLGFFAVGGHFLEVST